MCQNAGILAKGTLIFGSPAETPATFRETLTMIRKVKEIQPDAGIGVGSANGVFVYPGTPLFDWATQIGTLTPDFSWNEEFCNPEYASNSPLQSIPLLQNKKMVERINSWEEVKTLKTMTKRILKRILVQFGLYKRLY
jgi:radical SAM superfamily enzyme YgiQ (UPF0313 family)